MSTTAALNRLQTRIAEIRNGEHDRIGPGVPITLSRALSPGQAIAQGDVYLEVGSGIPAGYVKVENPKDEDRQLVFGNTQGARHCLDSLEGVELYRDPDWDADSLDGPYLIVHQERVVTHPTHGHVTIPAGMEIFVSYPRDYDLEQKKARRAAD